jgi:hypothetical protein
MFSVDGGDKKCVLDYFGGGGTSWKAVTWKRLESLWEDQVGS